MLIDRRFQRQAHAIFAMLADRAEQPRHHSRCFQFAVRAAQQPPQSAPRCAQLRDQLRRDLAHGVRLARQLGQIMPIANLASSKARPRMRHALAHAGDANIVHARGMRSHSSRAQRDGTEYQAPSILTIARELISTGMGLRTSKLAAGSGSSCTRSSAHSSLADLPASCRAANAASSSAEQLA